MTYNTTDSLRILINSYRTSCVIIAAVTSGLMRSMPIAQNCTVEDLASLVERLSKHQVERLLHGLEAMGIVQRSGQSSTESISPVRYLLTDSGRALKTDELLEADAWLAMDAMAAWALLGDAGLGPNTPYQRAYGRDPWRHRQMSPLLRSAFDLSMGRHSQIVASLVAESGALGDVGAHLTDLGGGTGHVAREILSRFPKLVVHIVDRPEVIEAAVRDRARDVEDPSDCRLSFFPVNVLTDVVPTAIVLLSNVLHDWPDDAATDILKSCFSKGARKVIVVERFVVPGSEFATAMFDLHMMAVTGGRQRTIVEIGQLAERAGGTTTNAMLPRAPAAFGLIVLEPR